jgi:flagellar hook assembly protein FlgD
VIDDDVRAGDTYYYTLLVHTAGGDDIRSVEVAVTVPSPKVVLGQNQPNPFATSTRFEFTLEEPGPVRVAVFDARGRLVRVLDEGVRNAGRYEEVWDGRDAGGRAVASGVYFYRLEGPKSGPARKMLLIR